MSRKKSTIRLLEERDFPDLAIYLERKTGARLNKKSWLELFTYWWQTNPAINNDIPSGWILFTDTDEIGGFLGNIPVQYLIHGKVTTVCCGTTWFVDDDFRHKSLDFLSRFLKQDRPLLNTTPIDKVYDIFTRLGFKELSANWLQKEGIYPVNAATFWDFLLNKKSSNKVLCSVLGKMSPFFSILIHAFLKLKKIGCNSKSTQFSAQEINSFNDSYDSLADDFNDTHSFLAQRTSQTLNWFFFGTNKIKSKRRVVEIRQNDSLVGYAGVKLVDNQENDKTFYYYEVVDLLLTSSEEGAFFTLFEGLLMLGKTSRHEIAFIKLSPFLQGIEPHMTRFGFQWQEGNSKYLHRGATKERTNKPFYATPLDGDRCFFP